mmetsp:Transcript_9194/g.21163  ORF Transcript_9194/g.21163 Transcript_9194/m.21163 type:complete len:383 (+) Transcript_9194:218-1366(+)
MLLRGVHDNVTISIVGECNDGNDDNDNDNDDDSPKAGNDENQQPPSSTRSLPSRVRTPTTTTTPRQPWSTRNASCTPATGSKATNGKKAFTFSPSSQPSWKTRQNNPNSNATPPRPQILTKAKKDIPHTYSDSEPLEDENPATDVVIASDSESDSSVRKSPRRLTLPAFLEEDEATRRSPPPSWRVRKAASAASVNSSSPLPPRKPLSKVPWSQQPKEKPNVSQKTMTKPTSPATNFVRPGSSKEVTTTTSTAASRNKTATWKKPAGVQMADRAVSTPTQTTATKPTPLPAKAQSVKNLSAEASSRAEDEVHQLVKDICRVGGGKPSVTFGALFDDEVVQQTYEALVGTLRSAKRQGLIQFKGQMLLKGMHDHVVIHVTQSS